MARRLLMAALLLVAMVGSTSVVEAARTKVISGTGDGCNSQAYIVSLSWERKRGPVAAVHWTRWLADGSGGWIEDANDTLQPDDALGAHVTWAGINVEGYYSYSAELLSTQGAVLANIDHRPTTTFCQVTT